jgi:fumarylacetoacetase
VAGPVLNPLMAAGPAVWQRSCATDVRACAGSSGTVELIPLTDVRMHLPFEVADYVDFYSSEQHATNVGKIFRPDADALTPELEAPADRLTTAGPAPLWSRAPTWCAPTVSASPATRARPTFGPSRRLDIEAEVGFVVGVPAAGPVPLSAFAEHVFGVVLLNDWSARDIQAWEYVPLGPFLGKSFATSISAWVLPLDALRWARVDPPIRDVPLSPTWIDAGAEPWGVDLAIEIELNGRVVSRPPFATMYWTPAQQLAHMTVNGATLRTGDLFASGTVSGPDRDQFGSLLELSWGGARRDRDGRRQAHLPRGRRRGGPARHRARTGGRRGGARRGGRPGAAGDADVTGVPQQSLGWLRRGTRPAAGPRRRAVGRRLRGAVAAPVVEPRHLVAHLALNAGALGNLVAWARTGVESPMYASAEQRAADIARPRRRAPRADPGRVPRRHRPAGRRPRRAARGVLGRAGAHRARAADPGERDPVDAQPGGLGARRGPRCRRRVRRLPAFAARRPARRCRRVDVRAGPEAAPVAARTPDGARTWAFGPDPTTTVTGDLPDLCALGTRPCRRWPG